MGKIKRFGVSLEEELLKKLDSFVKKHKFPNRSQAVRHLIHKNIVETEWQENRVVAGCLVIVYDHHKRDVVNKSIDIQHQFHKLILSNQHIHLDHYNCLEMIALKGRALELRKLADKIIALKGVIHGELVTTK